MCRSGMGDIHKYGYDNKLLTSLDDRDHSVEDVLQKVLINKD